MGMIVMITIAAVRQQPSEHVSGFAYMEVRYPGPSSPFARWSARLSGLGFTETASPTIISRIWSKCVPTSIYSIHKKELLTKYAQLVLASNSFYFLCNWAVKHALLLFYSEITRERKHLWSIYFMHFVAFGFGISSIFVNLFQCNPFSKAWDSDASGTCVRMDIFFYYNASMMLATDMVLYAMPVIFTRKLQLRRPQRIGLNCLFALGGL